jgi:hypothetical protein
MRAEENPRLDAAPDRNPAMAMFFLDPSGTLVEIVKRSDFRA